MIRYQPLATACGEADYLLFVDGKAVGVVEATRDRLARDVLTDALAVKKARRERVGGVPYGYRDEDGRLVNVPGEQVVIARARELRDEGLSLRAIGRALLEQGHTPRSGKRWHVQVVARFVDK